MIGQILSHLLRQRRNQDAFVSCRAFLCLVDDVIDLRTTRAYDDFGVEQARRTDDLLDEGLAGTFLVIAWRCRNVDELRNARFEFVEAQRTVIETAGQPETMLRQRDFTRAVPFMHAANLRNRHVALIDDA